MTFDLVEALIPSEIIYGEFTLQGALEPLSRCTNPSFQSPYESTGLEVWAAAEKMLSRAGEETWHTSGIFKKGHIQAFSVLWETWFQISALNLSLPDWVLDHIFFSSF